MNLNKLFELQKELDQHIIREKGLQGQDLLDKKILALQVELGELAQNWRGFKFWSEDQEPRYETVEIYVHGYDGPGQDTRASIQEYQAQPILEEYVDCLHFILSIGLELGYTFSPTTRWQSGTTTVHFNNLFHAVAILNESIESDWDEEDKQENFENIVGGFLGLGEMLGFTWEQIEKAYLEKNKINHQRQENGY